MQYSRPYPPTAPIAYAVLFLCNSMKADNETKSTSDRCGRFASLPWRSCPRVSEITQR
jgi:hypothetical protein